MTHDALRVLTALIGVALFALGQVSFAQTAPPDPEDVAQRIAALTDEFRNQEGRGNVAPSEPLMAAARYFAGYLAKSEQFSHGADGSSPIARAQRRGYDSGCVWENIAQRYSSSVPSAAELAMAFVEGWKKSPLHRQNMLETEATGTGIAVAPGKEGQYYAVQMFGLPGSQVIEFTVVNRSESNVNYVLGDRVYSLAPTDIRTHKQCQTEELTFGFRRQEKKEVFRPRRGERLRVMQEESGRFRVEVERERE